MNLEQDRHRLKYLKGFIEHFGIFRATPGRFVSNGVAPVSHAFEFVRCFMNTDVGRDYLVSFFERMIKESGSNLSAIAHRGESSEFLAMLDTDNFVKSVFVPNLGFLGNKYSEFYDEMNLIVLDLTKTDEVTRVIDYLAGLPEPRKVNRIFSIVSNKDIRSQFLDQGIEVVRLFDESDLNVVWDQSFYPMGIAEYEEIFADYLYTEFAPGKFCKLEDLRLAIATDQIAGGNDVHNRKGSSDGS